MYNTNNPNYLLKKKCMPQLPKFTKLNIYVNTLYSI